MQHALLTTASSTVVIAGMLATRVKGVEGQVPVDELNFRRPSNGKGKKPPHGSNARGHQDKRRKRKHFALGAVPPAHTAMH